MFFFYFSFLRLSLSNCRFLCDFSISLFIYFLFLVFYYCVILLLCYFTHRSMYGIVVSAPGAVTLHTVIGSNGYIDTDLSIAFSRQSESDISLSAGQPNMEKTSEKRPTVRYAEKRALLRSQTSMSEAIRGINSSSLTPQERGILEAWRSESKSIRRGLPRNLGSTGSSNTTASLSNTGIGERVNLFAPLAWDCFFAPLTARVDVSYARGLAGSVRTQDQTLHDDGTGGMSTFDESRGLSGLPGTSSMLRIPGLGLSPRSSSSSHDSDLNHVTMLSRDPMLLSKLIHTVAVFVECAGAFAADAERLTMAVFDLCRSAREHPQPAVRRAVKIAYHTLVSVLSPDQLAEGVMQEKVVEVISYIRTRLAGDEDDREKDEMTVVLSKEVLKAIMAQLQKAEQPEENGGSGSSDFTLRQRL